MSRWLASRLKRLEAKRRNRRSFTPIIFTLYEDEGAGEIVGLSSFGRDVPRLLGETCLAAFAERARATLGGARIMVARYALPEPPQASLELVAASAASTVQDERALASEFFGTVWLGTLSRA